MSLLSQFFPGGGGGSGTQKIEFLMVAGGGGGGASGGICIPRPCQTERCGGIIGGGGGGGQVVTADDYEVIQDVSYPITIGAGGAGGGFYYDTTNVYYPLVGVNPPAIVCPQIRNRNAGTLRGSNGGNTVFGSIVAYGGGGGGGGMSNQDTYLPFTCYTAAIQACDKWTAKGADGGTGGGSGSGYCGTTCEEIQALAPAPDARFGKAVYNSTLTTMRFGTNGVKFAVPSRFPNVSSPPLIGFSAEEAFSVLTYATGGGGNNQGGGNVIGAPICLVTPALSVTCFKTSNASDFLSDATTMCSGGQGFYSYRCAGGEAAAVNAFMEGCIGNSDSNHNIHMENNDFLGFLRGTDGVLSTITPSPEYYGGGGGVAYATNDLECSTLFGAIMSPNSPCYPSPVWQSNPCFTYLACPFGGRGGGGSVCTSLITCGPDLDNFRCILSGVCSGRLPGTRIVGVCAPLCGSGLPIPGCICPGAGVTNCGGGGASFHGGCVFTSTGPVFPNPTSDPCGGDTCAYCGYAGGSGTVVIRYPTVYCAATVSGNTPIAPQSGYHVYRFNGPGTITFPSS